MFRPFWVSLLSTTFWGDQPPLPWRPSQVSEPNDGKDMGDHGNRNPNLGVEMEQRSSQDLDTWLIGMVGKSAKDRVVPLPNGLNGLQMAVTNQLLTGMILQVG